MYEDNTKSSVNWLLFLIRGGIFLAILILLFIVGLLFTNTNEESYAYSYETNKYRDYLYVLKDAARNYFTESSLPKNVGSSTTLTLDVIINKNLIEDFTDNGKNCNLTNSYVKVTKTSDNIYSVKIQLDCDDLVDYIVTNIETN